MDDGQIKNQKTTDGHELVYDKVKLVYDKQLIQNTSMNFVAKWVLCHPYPLTHGLLPHFCLIQTISTAII